MRGLSVILFQQCRFLQIIHPHLQSVRRFLLQKRSGCQFLCDKTTQVVLHGVVNMQLPNQWLQDMVDEFVYQFQFCLHLYSLKSRKSDGDDGD
ncbi:hypothetical protein L1887_20580 [Cichorium endivia]|nr:hypothetical protein L1887_20580 [Cichorium endivia]